MHMQKEMETLRDTVIDKMDHKLRHQVMRQQLQMQRGMETMTLIALPFLLKIGLINKLISDCFY